MLPGSDALSDSPKTDEQPAGTRAAELLSWAEDRFEAAGLNMPEVVLSVHDTRDLQGFGRAVQGIEWRR